MAQSRNFRKHFEGNFCSYEGPPSRTTVEDAHFMDTLAGNELVLAFLSAVSQLFDKKFCRNRRSAMYNKRGARVGAQSR